MLCVLERRTHGRCRLQPGDAQRADDVCANSVLSQIDIHAEYGGIVPEIAARSHLEAMNPMIEQA
ncbi:MAG: hypothetical protein AAF330_02940, partial [Pseudomonadota bacterium]